MRDIKCPECETKNKYINRFCTSCGEKLWRSDVYDYRYDKSHFEHRLFSKNLPQKLRNISVFERNKSQLKPAPGDTGYEKGGGIKNLLSLDLKLKKSLSEINSRWKIVSPHYCINCLGIIKPHGYSCPKCGFDFTEDKKRAEYLQNTKNNYAEPVFDMVNLKFAFNFSDHYLGSLAPSIGESQLEYRERLKWEFAENTIVKNNIKKEMDRLRDFKPVTKPNPSRRKSGNGGYCDLSCIHCCEEFLNSSGAIVGDFDDGGYFEYYCNLGHALSYGSFCKDYK